MNNISKIHVTLKAAISLDGKIANADGKSNEFISKSENSYNKGECKTKTK